MTKSRQGDLGLHFTYPTNLAGAEEMARSLPGGVLDELEESGTSYEQLAEETVGGYLDSLMDGFNDGSHRAPWDSQGGGNCITGAP